MPSKTTTARMRSTARNTSPVSAYAVGDSPFVTAEQFEIRDASSSSLTVKPGDEITVTTKYGSEFQMFATRFDIDTDHPDYCTFDQLGFSPGADLYVEVEAGTTAKTDGGCWNVSNNDTVTESANVAVPPTSGAHTVDVRLVGGTTGRVYDSDSFEVQVDERAPGGTDRGDDGMEEEEEEEDDPKNDDCGPVKNALGLCESGDGGGGLVGQVEVFALLLIVVLAVVVR